MDLMPMDIFMWNILKNKMYHTLPENAEILKNRIRNACAEITSFMISRVKENFMRRIALCLEEDGDRIEHNYNLLHLKNKNICHYKYILL